MVETVIMLTSSLHQCRKRFYQRESGCQHNDGLADGQAGTSPRWFLGSAARTSRSAQVPRCQRVTPLINKTNS